MREQIEGPNGLIERWGIISESEGLFFEVDGDDVYVVNRSSESGSPVDTRTLVRMYSTAALVAIIARINDADPDAQELVVNPDSFNHTVKVSCYEISDEEMNAMLRPTRERESSYQQPWRRQGKRRGRSIR